jgi:hypothetical protein
VLTDWLALSHKTWRELRQVRKPAEKQKMTLSLEIMMTCKDDPSQKPSHLALRHIPYELNLSE